ncbi:hypothetical protein [Dietzia alimentaria]|uniref:hypothetical protein n=1 Tax=Dietzia alimentaria TaxID=665550 RepID=UPI0011453DD8|nr:hypothetical protein [Dietzia alimentaria]
MLFADAQEVALQIDRDLSTSDLARTEALVVAASRLLDQHVQVDQGDDDSLALAKIVVVDMVAEVIAPGEYRGHQSYSWRNGALAGSGSLVASAGSLRLLDWHLAMFGAPSALSPSWDFGDRVEL